MTAAERRRRRAMFPTSGRMVSLGRAALELLPLVRGGFAAGVGLAVIEPERWILLGCGYFDRQNRPGILAFEDGINGLEKKRFRACGRLREFGLKFQLAVEVERLGIEIVSPAQVN